MRQLRATTFIAAVASLAAGGVHLATGGPHLQESVPLGVAFIVVGWLQLLLGAAVWARPTRTTGAGLAVVHVAAIGAWAVSRTVGLPFGHPGGAPFGVAGVTAVALEAVGIAALIVFLREPDRVRHLPMTVALGALAIVLGGASVAVADVATGHGTTSGETPADHHGEGGEGVHGDPPEATEGAATEVDSTDHRSEGDAEQDDGGGEHGGDGHDHDH